MEDEDEQNGMCCTKCGLMRELSGFRVRRGKHQQPCKKCYLEYGRRHYQNNKQYYVDKAGRYNEALRQKTREGVRPCARRKAVQYQRSDKPELPQGEHRGGDRKMRGTLRQLPSHQDI